MKLTPNSTARRRTASAPALSLGGPQIPSPVIRIAPKPRRWTESSPPKDTSPAELAEIFFSFATVLLFTKTSGKFVVSQFDRPIYYWQPELSDVPDDHASGAGSFVAVKFSPTPGATVISLISHETHLFLMDGGEE